MSSRRAHDQPDVEGDFVQSVMRWTSSKVKADPGLNTLSPLTERYTSPSCFLPLIMEDVRANAAQGYEAQKHKRESTVMLKSVSPPRTAGNPWVLNFMGKIETDDDSDYLGLSVIQLFKSRGTNERPEIFLAIANQDGDPDGHRIKIRAYIRRDIRGDKILDHGQRWKATYLCSVVTYERMYCACQALQNMFLTVRGIFQATPAALPSLSSFTLLPRLNESQSRAVRTFLHLNTQLLLLQGPPGTGKTTTISTLLAELVKSGTRTLVCAPSNKAIEVLAARFLTESTASRMLLIGVESKIKDHLASISLNSILREIRRLFNSAATRLEALVLKYRGKVLADEDLKTIHAGVALVKSDLAVARLPIAKYRIAPLVTTIDNFCSHLSLYEDRAFSHTTFSKVAQLPDELRSVNVAEGDLIWNAAVVFCTLSVSGRRQLLGEAGVRFDALIVDEAAQSVEAETLIALQHNPSKILLVGDTKQLPATVISTFAKDKHYDWSLMHRLADLCGVPSLMLEEQYRMHPAISAWPSAQYYEGRLRDGTTRTRPASCPEWPHPIAFYDMTSAGNKEEKVGKSTANIKEAKFIAQVLQKLRTVDRTSTVGIIVPYLAQVEFIEKETKALKITMLNTRVSTVDSFQGDECDYIFLSFVRFGNSVGFTDNAQRLNVAITRAKHALLMIGSEVTLNKSDECKCMFAHLKRARCFHPQAQLEGHLGITDAGAALSSALTGLKISGESPRKKNSGQVTAPAVSASPPPPPPTKPAAGASPPQAPADPHASSAVQGGASGDKNKRGGPKRGGPKRGGPKRPKKSAAPPAPPADSTILTSHSHVAVATPAAAGGKGKRGKWWIKGK